MHVLVIGGTRFVGRMLVTRLLARGDRVTTFHRGTVADAPVLGGVEWVRGDRTTDDLPRALAGRRFDAVVDFAAYARSDVDRAIDALGERAGHYVLVSTGQVYLVRSPRPTIAREEDFDGAVMDRPTDDASIGQWEYGVGKRGCEEALIDARGRFPSTRLRIPMVAGIRDYDLRLHAYLARMIDGGPIVVPDGGGHRVRHVDADDVATAIARLLGDAATFGEAYNLAQSETPTLLELLDLVRSMMGARTSFVSVSSEALRARGVEPVQISPFSGRWMSFLDPSKATRALSFRATPIATTIGHVVASFLGDPRCDHPGLRHREIERALA